MSVSIQIHRGTHQIGGSITEIATDKSRILIDFGCDLRKDPDRNTDARMIRMIRENVYDAVLFTHYHGDHAGLMEFVPERTPMYIGGLARKVMITIRKALRDNPWLSDDERADHKRVLDTLLKNDDRLINYYDGQSFVVGSGQDITVTPILTDHSACDAYMFVIEAEGKCILHSGDFRTHGRLGRNLFPELGKRLQGRKIDVLIIEGTMMSRGNEAVMTEQKLQERAEKILSAHPYAFLLCSSTNVESLASFSLAALNCRRPMYVSRYVNQQIGLYRRHFEKTEERWDFGFQKVYAIEPAGCSNGKLGMTQREYMRRNGFLILVNKYGYLGELMQSFSDCIPKPVMIYSMWSGYIDDPHSDTYDPELAKTANMFGKPVICHTSGHAVSEDLSKLIRLTAPEQAIIPIHTERPERFDALCGDAYREKMRYLKDGDIFLLQ